MNVLTWQYCSFCSICLKERSIDNEYFVFGGSRILIVTWSHHRKKPTIFGLNLPTYLYHHHALHDQSSLLAVESIFCARLAIIQKYNGGHKWRIQYATRGAMGAIVMSSSSRRTAFSISLATFSGEAPVAVAASFFPYWFPVPVSALRDNAVLMYPGETNVTFTLCSAISARRLSQKACRACFEAP